MSDLAVALLAAQTQTIPRTAGGDFGDLPFLTVELGEVYFVFDLTPVDDLLPDHVADLAGEGEDWF